MPAPVYTTYPGLGEWAAETLNYSQAARVGDRIYLSGQGACEKMTQQASFLTAKAVEGGWDPDSDVVALRSTLAEEIEQAFKNVELALKTAGAKGWENVYKLHSYHAHWQDDVASGEVDQGPTKIIADMLRKYCGHHKPVWTQIGVARLGMEKMRIEIEVEAYVGI